MSTPRPFRIAVSDEAIQNLNVRLKTTYWPDQIDCEPWAYGADLNTIKELVRHWREEYDWRKHEAALNQFNQYLLTIDGLDTHYIHQRSTHSSAVPLLITHGWPGSIVEFTQLIHRLTQPELYGGSAEDAFHVICPSLPGVAWSQAPTQTGMTARQIAVRHAQLMALLGYDKYIAQGGDWGAIISREMPAVDPEHCIALHINMVVADAPQGLADPMEVVTESEAALLQRSASYFEAGMGYAHIQSTRPQTLAYGLADSPAGLAAWITEKFHEWTDPASAIERDQELTNIALYWFSQSITPSMRLYREEKLQPSPGAAVSVPTGAAIYPFEIAHTPRAWAERHYNIVRWARHEKGGHFAAMEQPEVFAKDMWEFKVDLLDGGWIG